MASAKNQDLQWLQPEDTPWPVPVLDIRPLTQTMLSASADSQMASNAVSFGGDDGLGFVGHETPSQTVTQLALRYRVSPMLADGVLFSPTAMEHKWALFHYGGTILFVRSWQRRVVVTTTAHQSSGYVELTEARGEFPGSDLDPRFISAYIDFLVRTHALLLDFPAPLETDPEDDGRGAALASFNHFGKMARYATHHRFTVDPPERPLRSHSLFHIAIAKGDLYAAQMQLARGVPVDLLAGDGLSAIHWALASRNHTASSWLLDHGLAIDTRSEEGATALMNAVQDDNAQGAQWLLNHGANANAADNRGFTSLHRAAEMGLETTVRLLLDHGARPDMIAQGHTPADLARGRGHDRIAGLIGSGSS